MTQQPVALPPLPFGYHIGKVPVARRAAVVKEIAVAVGEDFKAKHDAAIEAMGFVKPEPFVRAQTYFNVKPGQKPEEMWDDARWQALYLKFPVRFKELWPDFEMLRLRALAGDFDARDGGELRALAVGYDVDEAALV